MLSKKKKIIKISLFLLLFFLLIIQGVKGRSIIQEHKSLYLEITKQQYKNQTLKNEYSSSSGRQLFDLKAKTSEIFAELKSCSLKIIDYSSTEGELNLNLRGDFNSILKFIYYLDNETEGLKIDEFKIKEDQDTLFFFVKLKNELM